VGATGVTLVVYVVGVMGGMLLLPLYFQIVRGESAFWSGLLLAPQGIGAMLAMQLGGRLVDRIGPGRVIVPGVVLSVVGFAVFAVVGATTPFWLLCGELFISGVGLGMVLMPTFTAVMQNVQPAAIARASTALNIIQQGATSIGTALFSIVLTSQLAAHFGNAGNGGALAAARAVPAGLRAQLAPVIAAGFAHTFVWTLVLVGVTFFSALLLLRGRARSQMAPSAEAVDEEPAA
jgi:MFS family permease